MKSIFKGPVSATYNAWTAYANSKLGNMLMSFELSRRLEKAKGNREEWRELIYYDPLKSSSAPTTKPAEKKKARLNPFAAPPPSTADPYDTSFASSSTLAFPYITVNAMTPGMVNTELPRHMHSPLAYLFYPVRMLTWKTPTEGGSEIVFAAAQQRVSGKFFGEKKEVCDIWRPCRLLLSLITLHIHDFRYHAQWWQRIPSLARHCGGRLSECCRNCSCIAPLTSNTFLHGQPMQFEKNHAHPAYSTV